MSKQEIIEGNKLIAEFLELDKKIYGETGITYYIDSIPYQIFKLKYHSSWNWLMPVVEKIENDCKVHICTYNKSCWIEFYGTHNDPCKFERTNNSFILNVYLTVIEFIKWYLCQKEMKLI